MEDVRIRQCKPQESDKAYELYAALSTEVKEVNAVPDEGVQDRISEYFLVAEVNNKFVGIIIAELQTVEFMNSEIGRDAFPGEKEYLEVQELYVVPGYRRKGTGKKLVEAVLAKAKKNGIQRSMVYSANTDYISTARFYEKCGYKMWHIFMTQ